MKKKRNGILLVALLLPILALIMDYQGRELQDNTISLNDVGEGSKEIVLEVQGEDVLERQEITLILPERRLTTEEETAYIERAKTEIEQSFYGEGEGKEAVYSRVHPKENYCGGIVTASWRLGNYRILDLDGERTAYEVEDEGEDLLVEAELICGETTEVFSEVIHVYPEVKSEAERLLESILITIKLQEEAPGQKKVELPAMENGVKLKWKETFPHTGLKIMLLELVVLSLYPLIRREQKRKEERNREKSLLLEYPNLVNKLSVLVGCGMSIKQSWYRISACETDKEQKGGKMLREEMQFTARELESGASERQAYQDFADRIHVQPYYRLCRILIQDLEKGGGGLKELLRNESEAAFKERTLLARKLGEEAETKMIGPLMMMMGVVMIIVIAPAIIEFTV